MKYEILFISNDLKSEQSSRLVSALSNGKNHCHEFSFEQVQIDNYSNIISSEIISKAKRAQAVLAHFEKGGEEILTALARELSLHSTAVTHGNLTIVTNTSVRIDGGYQKNEGKGREAYDKLLYGELEIESVLRTAYALADEKERTLTLIDDADEMVTSKLWRKITADLNEDYPFVRVTALLSKDAHKLFDENAKTVAVCPRHIAKILCGFASTNEPHCTAYYGDTPLAIYLAQSQNSFDLVANQLLAHSTDYD